MPNRAKPTHRGVDKQKRRGGSGSRRGRASPGDQTQSCRDPVLSGYCAVCNLTFGSQERTVFWDEKAAHPECVRRIRRLEAA